MTIPGLAEADAAVTAAVSALHDAEHVLDSARRARSRVYGDWYAATVGGQWCATDDGMPGAYMQAGAVRVALVAHSRPDRPYRAWRAVAYCTNAYAVPHVEGYGATPTAALSELRASVAASRRSARRAVTQRALDTAAEMLAGVLDLP